MKKQNTNTCIIVTLVRGRVYIYKGHRFEYQVPTIVDDEELAQELENIGIEVVDRDGEILVKSCFDVDYEADRASFDRYNKKKREEELASSPRKRVQTIAKPVQRFRAGDDAAKTPRSKRKETEDNEPKSPPVIKKRLKPTARKAS